MANMATESVTLWLHNVLMSHLVKYDKNKCQTNAPLQPKTCGLCGSVTSLNPLVLTSVPLIIRLASHLHPLLPRVDSSTVLIKQIKKKRKKEDKATFVMRSLTRSLQANTRQRQVAPVRDLELFRAIFHSSSNGMSAICPPSVRVALSVGEPVIFC